MPEQFFVQLYEKIKGELQFNNMTFESADLGREVPRVGDCIISPSRKADFEPRNPAKHEVFEVVRRYFLPDITQEQASIVKLVVKRRNLTEAERALFNVR